jgi:hypothetical protein
MPQLGTLAAVQQGYLQPRVGPGSGYGTLAPELSDEQKQQMTQKLFNTQYNENKGISWYRGVAETAAGSLLNFGADIVSLTPGVDKTDVWDFIGDYGPVVGSELQDYYRRNQSRIDTISGIGGAIGTGVLAGEVLLPKIASSLASSTIISSSRLWQAGARINAATRAAMEAGNMESAFAQQAYSVLRSTSGRRFLAGQIAKGAAKGLAEEVAIAAVMHNNEAIWSDDMSTNLMWAGVGVTVGGLVGSVGAFAEMRRYANSPVMLQARAAQVDPQGITFLREDQPAINIAAQVQSIVPAKESAVGTAYALEWRQSAPHNAVPQAQTRFEQATVKAGEAVKLSNGKVLSKGVTGVGNTRIAGDSLEGEHMFQAQYEDPMANFGLDSAGRLPDDDTKYLVAKMPAPVRTTDRTILQARRDFAAFGQKASPQNPFTAGLSRAEAQKYADELDALKVQSQAHTLAAAKLQDAPPLERLLGARDLAVKALVGSHLVSNIREGVRLAAQDAKILVSGKWISARHPEAVTLSAYKPGKVKLKQLTAGVQAFRFDTQGGRTIRVDETFRPTMGNQTLAFSSLPIDERLSVIEGMNAFMDSMLRSGSAHAIQKNAGWFELDNAIRFAEKGGTVQLQNTPFTSMEEVMVESLKKKAAAIGNNKRLDYWGRLAYNLPLPNASESIYDAVGDSMRAVLDAATQGANQAQLEQLRATTMNIHGFSLKSDGTPLMGNMWTFNKGTTGKSKGKWMNPVVGFFDSVNNMPTFDARGVGEMLAEQKVQRTLTLADPSVPGGFMAALTQVMLRNPDFMASMEVRALQDDQITGIGNYASQIAGEFVTREFQARDSKTILALTRVREMVNRASNAQLHELMTQEMGDVVQRLSAAPAAGSKSLVNQFFSNTSGWDLEATPVATGTGFWAFELSETAANAKRLGRSVAQGETLVNMRTQKEIVLDDLGLEYATRFNAVANRILTDKNKVRTAMGLTELRVKPWYTPPPDTRNKIVAFTFDEDNNVVPGGAIIASTQAEYDHQFNLLSANLPMGHTIRTKDQVAAAGDLYDRAAMDWLDPGITVAPAKNQVGGLSSASVNPKAIEDSLTWVKSQTEANGTGFMRVMYDSQLGIVRARGAVERLARATPEDSPIRNIFDVYEATALGKSLGSMQRSISGSVMKKPESVINGTIAAVWPAMKWMAPSQLNNWVGDLYQRLGIRAPKSARTFNELVNQIGTNTPYQNAVDYAEQTFKVSRPPEIRAITQEMSRLSASLLLRWFEIPMAAMNMVGLITTMPSIIQSGRAPVTSHFNVGTRRLGVVDTMKIMMDATKDMVSQRSLADWQVMVKNGDTKQQVADFNSIMASLTDRSKTMQVLLGNPAKEAKNIKHWRSIADGMNSAKALGIDGLISVATDTTENWSRSWSHFVGLRLADLQGITGVEARHSFAREVANAAIANYNPMNRPEMYQSAFGSQFGLFMSYMQSYNQRLFRWMEDGDYQSIGRQLSMQTTLFGVSSLPGFNVVQAALMTAGVGKTEQGDDATLIDNIYAKLGPVVGSAVAHGSIAQLGVALYTRGDMNYREPTLDPTKLMASLGIASQAASWVKESYNTLFDPNSLDGNGKLLEVLARNMPNRVMKGMLSQYANGGRDIDARGKIISENKTMAETWIRMLGVRSTRQQAEVEAFYANQSAIAKDAAKMEVLRGETRSLMRNDPDWKNRIMDVFDQYVKTGGRPEHFRTWIKDQIRESTGTRGVNDLVQAMRNPTGQQAVWRYNAYGAN